MSEEKLLTIFSRNLKKYLSEQNHTQADLCKYMHVSSATVSDWCNARKMPRADKIQAIASWLEVSIGDLMEEKEADAEEHYYLNDETREIAQEVFENPDLRSLFHVARDIEPEELRAHIDFMKRLKARERKDTDEGC